MKIINFKHFLTRFFSAMEWVFTHMAQSMRIITPQVQKGIYIVSASHGYTVKIDDYTLDFELSYNKAKELAAYLEKLR